MNNREYHWGDNERIRTILSLENKYPVHEWKINGIHVWPLLRMFLYIELWVETERKKTAHVKVKAREQKQIRHINFFRRFQKIIRFLLFLLKPLKKAHALFASVPTYMEEYQGRKYHKFFDPLRMKDSRYRDAYLVFKGAESVPGISNQLHTGEFHYILQLFAKYYRKRGIKSELAQFEQFKQELSESYDLGKRLTVSWLEEAIVSVEQYAFLFKIILKKTHAKEAISICYYSDTFEHFGLNLAAHRLGITSIDVQHGGQGILHLGYSQFYKLPASRSFELLPHSFWCWDEQSAVSIREWIIAGAAKHSVNVIGHPWFEFLKVNATKQPDKPIIVYSLQPFQTLLLPQIIECMHLLGEKCSWILRLHPHMQWRREELLEVIQSERLGNCIHPQTYEPLTLPETLAQASLHITRTSGTVIEATLMGVTTLILDSDGAKAYEQYISAGSAIDASTWTGENFVHFLDTQLGQ